MLTLADLANGPNQTRTPGLERRWLGPRQTELLLWIRRKAGVERPLSLVAWKERIVGSPSKSAVRSRALRGLEDRGFVRRLNLAGVGRRVTHVLLTEAGLQACNRLEALAGSDGET